MWTDIARPHWDVDLPIIGVDGNVFNLIGIAKRTLKTHLIHDLGRDPAEARETCEMLVKYLTSSTSYNEVLNKLGDMFCITSIEGR